MKYLGIDYGTKRIGVAVSDEAGRVAFPREVIAAGPTALSVLEALIKAENIGTVVVGESRALSGEKNAVMEDIEQFARDLQELSGAPVVFETEVFSSSLAARQFAPEEKSRKANPEHKNLDASAAALILQSYLDRTNK